MCQLRKISSRMRRFVALSSTTSTRIPWRHGGSGGGGSGCAGSARPSRSVKWNWLPCPGSLSTQIRPSIISTRREAMASPSPVPPWRRVIEASACSNISKMAACLSAGMPMPVSLTQKCSAASVGDSDSARTSSTTSPLLGELEGVAHQVDDDLPQPAVVAHQQVGHVGMDVVGQLQILLVGAQGERLHRVAEALPQVERLALQVQLAGLDLREVQDVVDHRQQCLAGITHGGEELALLGRQLALQHQFGHADHGVERRADLVAHIRQERALRPAGGLGSVLGPQQLGIGAGQLGGPLTTRCSSSSCACCSASSASCVAPAATCPASAVSAGARPPHRIPASLLPTPATATIWSPSKIGTFMWRVTCTWPAG